MRPLLAASCLCVVLAAGTAVSAGWLYDPLLGLRFDAAGSVVAGSTLATSLSGLQTADADLTYLAGVTLTANVKTILGAADFAAIRTSLSVRPGQDIQAYDADLATWAGVTPSANGQSLVAAANYAAMLGLLGAEPALGNPGTSGYVLSSTTAGVRSWIAQTDTAYLTNRVQVLERNGLYLAISSAITTNLAWQWGYETFWDQYEDETAIGTKTGAYYNATDDFYSSTTPGTSDLTAPGMTCYPADGGGENNPTATIDNNGGTYASTESVTVDLGDGQAKVVTSCAITYFSSSPDTFVFYGSNNNTEWTTLHSTGSITWGTNPKTFSWANTTAYRYVKYTKGLHGGGGSFVAEQEWFGETTANVTLISTMQELVAVPTGGTLMLVIDPNAATLGTDLKFYLTRDGGTTWCEVTLAKADAITPLAGYETWIGDVLFAGPTGQSGGYKIQGFGTPQDVDFKASAWQVRP